MKLAPRRTACPAAPHSGLAVAPTREGPHNAEGFPPTHQKADVLQKAEVSDVHPEVLHDFGVVQVVGEVIRERVVAVCCHLLRSVAGGRFIDTWPATLSVLLPRRKGLWLPFRTQEEQSQGKALHRSNFKAPGMNPFKQSSRFPIILLRDKIPRGQSFKRANDFIG